jgi:hypothetical protein
MPGRADIRESDLRALLPNLMILEPVEDGADWAVRLCGSAIAERYSFDPTGKRIGEIFLPDAAAACFADYRDAIESRSPRIIVARTDIADKDHVVYEAIALPLLGRDGRTPWILVGLFFRN